jgi:hypothetical protein
MMVTLLNYFLSFIQNLREELSMKRQLVEQTLEAGRQYLQEEGEDNRLSVDSGDSSETGKYITQYSKAGHKTNA